MPKYWSFWCKYWSFLVQVLTEIRLLVYNNSSFVISLTYYLFSLSSSSVLFINRFTALSKSLSNILISRSR